MSSFEISLPARSRSPEVAPTNAPLVWGPAQLDGFLQRHDLAAWASAWLRDLGARHGAVFPRLLQLGLGARDVAEIEPPRWMRRGAPDAVWLRGFLGDPGRLVAWLERGFLEDDPAWLARLLDLERARVARSFLLSGNIIDYAFDPVCGWRPATRLLVDALTQAKDVVLTYRLSEGLMAHAADPTMLDVLPEDIREELGRPAFEADVPMARRVCQLMDLLRRWLTPRAGGRAAEFTRGVGIVFENVHLLVGEGRGDLDRNFVVDNLLHWSISPELFHSEHCLVLLADTLEDVTNDLRARGGKIEQIQINRPDSRLARFKFLLPALEGARAQMPATRIVSATRLAGYAGRGHLEQVEGVAHDTAGLTLLGIEDLLQQAAARPERTLDRATVMGLKRERLRQESDGLVEVVIPRYRLEDIGGYKEIKERLGDLVDSLRSASDPLVQATLPMGVLFLGPPGTGKSIMAEALASASDISLVRLGDFRGMYVGQSERNLSRIFSLIESLYPVIVFVDEIDQAIGKRSTSSTDGGVDRRIFGRFLEFLSDTRHRGRILWVGASNYPDQIDDAFKRPGRFDLVLPFLLPDSASRAAILAKSLRGELRDVPDLTDGLTQADYDLLAERTDGFSGAELRAIVGEVLRQIAVRRARGDRPTSVDLSVFVRALEAYCPAKDVREGYRRMELLAVKAVSFVDFVPERYRTRRE